jgi:toxin ParE1/3/4
MDYKVVWTDPAIADLHDVVKFIASEDPITARRIGHEILAHVAILMTFPHIGPVYLPRPDHEVREILCRTFRIFYRVIPATHAVEVIHVWHSKRGKPSF